MLETFICRDTFSLYYPTAPGRVYSIRIKDLAHYDGDSGHLITCTMVVSIMDIPEEPFPLRDTPSRWPWHDYEEYEERDADFADAVEMWLDWCDEDSARLDALDGVPDAAAATA